MANHIPHIVTIKKGEDQHRLTIYMGIIIVHNIGIKESLEWSPAKIILHHIFSIVCLPENIS